MPVSPFVSHEEVEGPQGLLKLIRILLTFFKKKYILGMLTLSLFVIYTETHIIEKAIDSYLYVIVEGWETTKI